MATRAGRTLALVMALALTGCAQTPRAGTGATFGPAYRSLLGRSEGVSRLDAPLPAGLPKSLAMAVGLDDPGFAAASKGLEETINGLCGTPAAAPIEPAAASAAAGAGALRRYIAGREKLLSGDPGGAIEELRRATHLDPAAPEPWRELGAAQAAMGLRGEAAASYEAAVARGLGEAPGLEVLGRARLERGDAHGAAVALAHAWRADPRGSDPGLPVVVLGSLGRALIQDGRLSAGREALVLMLSELERVPGPTRYAQELGTLVRQRGELWRDAGDAACRLGRFPGAIEDYTRAAGYPSVEDLDLTARVVYAAIRDGRPGAGAVFLLDAIAAGGGHVGPREQELLAAVADDPGVRRDLVSALASYRRSLPVTAPLATRGGLVRAEAALLDADEAREALVEHLRQHPEDAETMESLLVTSARPAEDAVRLVTGQPLDAERIAAALYRARADVDEVLRGLSEATQPAGGVLSVYVEFQRSRRQAAWEMARALRPKGRWIDAVLLAKTRGAAAVGRWENAQAAAGLIEPDRGEDSRRARALALHALQRDAEALAAIKPLTGGGQSEDLLLAATLVLGGRAEDAALTEAETWLRTVLERDPRSDRAFAMLLRLYGASGPRADQEKLSQTVRALRENAEGGRLLALLRAREFLARSMTRQAEQSLLALARQDASDAEVLDLLASIWEQPDSAGGGREVDPVAWLQERHAERPSDPAITAALARVLIGLDRGDEGEALVRERLAAGDDPGLSRILENLLRGTPGGAEAADQMALERLEPMPRTIDESLELADAYTRLNRPDEAATAVLEGVPPGVTLRGPQRDLLMLVAARLTQAATQEPLTGRPEPAEFRSASRRLLDEMVERGIGFAPELHQVRIELLASDPDGDEESLLAAVDLASREYPTLGPAPILHAAEVLQRAGRPAPALRLMERAAQSPGADADVYRFWALMVARGGAAAEARLLIERAAGAGVLGTLLPAAAESATGDAGSAEPRAELAYQIGVQAGGLGREDAAEAMYELALEYDPGHAWASNNLGYALADRGEQLERAEQLLERAYSTLPGESSILDSLAWLRYRLGVLEDQTDPATGNVRAGALTLLERAVATGAGRSSPVILDHYADALWAAGRQEEARRKWVESQRATAVRLRTLSASRGQEVSTVEATQIEEMRQEMLQLQMRVRAKIDAARRGQEVPYAPPGKAPSAAAEEGGGQ